MSNYDEPEYRSRITFTREDSDRLVRLEEQMLDNGAKIDTVLAKLEGAHTKIATQNIRISKIERRQSWVMGIGTAIAFIISIVVGFFKHHQ